MTYRVSDQNTGQSVTVEDSSDVVDAIRGWFPLPDAEVAEVLDALHTKLVHREYTGDEEAFLGVTIEHQ